MYVDIDDTLAVYTLASLRKSRELTQKDVFHLTGIPKSTLGCWERGSNTPSAESLYRLKKAYRFTGDMLEIWANTIKRRMGELELEPGSVEE